MSSGNGTHELALCRAEPTTSMTGPAVGGSRASCSRASRSRPTIDQGRKASITGANAQTRTGEGSCGKLTTAVWTPTSASCR